MRVGGVSTRVSAQAVLSTLLQLSDLYSFHYCNVNVVRQPPLTSSEVHEPHEPPYVPTFPLYLRYISRLERGEEAAVLPGVRARRRALDGQIGPEEVHQVGLLGQVDAHDLSRVRGRGRGRGRGRVRARARVRVRARARVGARARVLGCARGDRVDDAAGQLPHLVRGRG